MKALGATNARIMVHFLAQVMLLTLGGVVAGPAAGHGHHAGGAAHPRRPAVDQPAAVGRAAFAADRRPASACSSASPSATCRCAARRDLQPGAAVPLCRLRRSKAGWAGATCCAPGSSCRCWLAAAAMVGLAVAMAPAGRCWSSGTASAPSPPSPCCGWPRFGLQACCASCRRCPTPAAQCAQVHPPPRRAGPGGDPVARPRASRCCC